MFSFLTGKIAMPDRVISNIRDSPENLDLETDKTLKK